MSVDTEKYKGTWTALITPFKGEGKGSVIDYDVLEKLVEAQVAGGVTGILVVGTTGESPTLRSAEIPEFIQRMKELIAGRCLLMVGCGTNSTEKSVANAVEAEECGVDALLVVNPYYNKPTQEGLYRHFRAVAEATPLPMFVYNIKGRTGVNVETSTLMRLARDISNIVGVKEASGDLGQIEEVCRERPEGFVVLSGDDGITHEIITKFGADGVISVASNVLPAKVCEMVEASCAGKPEAGALDSEIQPFFEALFLETNPIPVKYLLHALGFCELAYRLPICEPSQATREKLDSIIKTL